MSQAQVASAVCLSLGRVLAKTEYHTSYIHAQSVRLQFPRRTRPRAALYGPCYDPVYEYVRLAYVDGSRAVPTCRVRAVSTNRYTYAHIAYAYAPPNRIQSCFNSIVITHNVGLTKAHLCVPYQLPVFRQTRALGGHEAPAA